MSRDITKPLRSPARLDTDRTIHTTVNRIIYAAKRKAVVSCAVTSQLIKAFASHAQKADILMTWLIYVHVIDMISWGSTL